MRIIIIAILMALPCYIFAQDKLDPNPIGFTTTPLNSMTIQRNPNKFIRGWNWGSAGRKLDEALNINTYHNFPQNSNDYIDGIYIIEPLDSIVGGRTTNRVLNAHAVYYEPALLVNTSDIDFEPMPFDRNGGVFGFQTRRLGTILDQSQNQDPNYGKFILDSTSISFTPEIVLANPWRDDIMHYLNYTHEGEYYKNPMENDSLNGVGLIISMKIRATAALHPDLMNTTILSRPSLDDIRFSTKSIAFSDSFSSVLNCSVLTSFSAEK